MISTAEARFNPETLAQQVPPLALQYLTHAIRPGAPVARRAEITFHGSVRMKSQLPWLSFHGRETLKVARAYHVTARAHLGPIPVTTQDWYAQGAAASRILLFGFIPVMTLTGPMPPVPRAAALWWSPRGSHPPSCRNLGHSGPKRADVCGSRCRSITKMYR